MTTLSVFLGVVCILIAFIPYIGLIVIFPAVVGMIIGLIAYADSSGREQKRASLGGLLNSIALILCFGWPAVLGFINDREERDKQERERIARYEREEREEEAKQEEERKQAELESRRKEEANKILREKAAVADKERKSLGRV